MMYLHSASVDVFLHIECTLDSCCFNIIDFHNIILARKELYLQTKPLADTRVNKVCLANSVIYLSMINST